MVKKAKKIVEDGEERIQVFLRLRPMDKFETSKRSKDCIELHKNPMKITVDSPLMGTFDFSFDQVFDEYTPQQDVYKEAVEEVPERVVDGINCTVIAYGQTGTGKTFTMLGEGLGVEMNVRAAESIMSNGGHPPTPPQTTPASDQEMDPKKNPDWTEGMIPRVVADLFKILEEEPDSLEFVIRCSYVEIYLEKICDLIQPWREDIRIGTAEDGEPCILGASEICCLNASDVYTLLARGNAYRTKANTDQNIDSSRSHAVFTLRLEKTDPFTGMMMSSRLQMFDLAGSEIGKGKSTRHADSAIGMEGRMINASLQSVQNVVRGTLAQQGKDKNARFNPRAYVHMSKLAKLLRPCFGWGWYTTLICTGSPSSYNINETINTIKFGQQVREITNKPKKWETLAPKICRARMSCCEKKHTNLMALVRMLAHECKHVRGRTKGKDSGDTVLWEAIEKIVENTERDKDVASLKVSIRKKDEPETEEEKEQEGNKKRIEELEKQLEEKARAVEKAENAVRNMKSEVTALRSQTERFTKEKQILGVELAGAKDEIKLLHIRKAEMDQRLRTSQFRESEAVLFLREFRSFYSRLLKTKAAQGNGTTKSITEDVSQRIPGVTDLADLVDVDRLLIQSGLIEDEELGVDANTPDYYPSKVALMRSDQEAEKAEAKEKDLIGNNLENHEFDMTTNQVSNSDTNQSKKSNNSWFLVGQLNRYRQRLLETPAGRLSVQKEMELERDTDELARKVATLQNSLIAEKGMVEALSSRQGAMSKMKAAQELTMMKQELERKTNDLHAIVWKLNELHLVNKTVFTKSESREQHLTYLEDQMIDLQTKNRRLVSEKQEVDRKLKEEISKLKLQLDGMAANIWQMGESKESLPPWRLVLPYTAEKLDLSLPIDEKRRMSLGDLEDEEIDGIVKIVPVNNK